MAEFSITSEQRNEIIDITAEVNARIPAGLESGICHISTPHTTAAISINENADPDVKADLLAKLDKLIPQHENYYRHVEGNSAAHLKSTLIGVSVSVPVLNGKLDLGKWQAIYFCEFDGPRRRRIVLNFISTLA